MSFSLDLLIPLNPEDPALESAFAKDINHYQFIPYIQLYEFEALIFTDLEELYKDFPDNDQYKKGIDRLLEECRKYSSPELINQGVTTAPSKRLEKVRLIWV